ncbi:MAG: hypothetical protein AAF797_12915 [Planctomycetota bacterium]
MTYLPDQGTWLTNADGQPLASVLSANPDPDHPGCVSVHVLPHREDGDLLLTQGTGAWRVLDRQTDLCFCIQALSCASTGLGYEIMVSSLGEPTAEPNTQDDDYLVIQGHDPIPLREVLIADGRCASGLHIRCEFHTEHFSDLPFEVVGATRCRCGKHAEHAGELQGSLPQYIQPASCEHVHRWQFCNLRCAAPQTGEQHAAIVRLRQRLILNCEFHIAMLDAPGDAETAVCIGHVISEQQWHKRGS